MHPAQYISKKFRVNEIYEVPPFTGRRETSRDFLAQIFYELGYKIGAEIGVHRGEYSKRLLELNPNLKLYCIDPWTPYVHHSTQRRQDRHFAAARQALTGLNAEFLVKTSLEALKDISDNSLDFVYIDGLHEFDDVILDIIGWNRKVRSGGVIAAHDYFHWYNVGIIPAVDAFVRAHNINPYFVTKDHPPSVFWVKP